MAMITLVEYCKRNGIVLVTARHKALRGTFKTAAKVGRDWLIDENEPYDDARITTGKYIGFRDKLHHGKSDEE